LSEGLVSERLVNVLRKDAPLRNERLKSGHPRIGRLKHVAQRRGKSRSLPSPLRKSKRSRRSSSYPMRNKPGSSLHRAKARIVLVADVVAEVAEAVREAAAIENERVLIAKPPRAIVSGVMLAAKSLPIDPNELSRHRTIH
jgi:hypothetical protein